MRRASATVHLPKGAHTVLGDGYAGPPNRRYFTVDVSETDEGDVLEYSTTRQLRPGGVFAVAVDLTKGAARPALIQRVRHFDRMTGRTLSSTAVFITGLGAALAYFVLAWLHVGKDPRRGVVVPAYEPPPGVSPAFARYLASRRRVDDASVAATLVRLAQRDAVRVAEQQGRYRLEWTGAQPAGCQAHEAAFMQSLFTGTKELALGTPGARSRLRAARRVLRNALRVEARTLVPGNLRFFWPGLLLAVAGAAGAILVDPLPPIGTAAYLGLLTAGIVLVTMPWVFLLKAPTRAARTLFDRIEGFRMFLEAAYTGAAVVGDRPGRELPSAIAGHLSYAIAFGIDVERISVLRAGAPWFNGRSGGFSAGDFAGAFRRRTA